AEGFSSYLLATNLTSPRGLVFDFEGNLLISQRVTKGNPRENGIFGLRLKDEGGCVSVVSKELVAPHPNGAVNEPLNHGLTLSPDGKTLYASSMTHVYAWSYDSKSMKTTGEPKSIITGFGKPGGHSTRTILALKKSPGTLLVSRGSVGNLDPDARVIGSGASQIRAFDVSDLSKEYKYPDGELIGWGLRNSIGLGENPVDGGIWSNENGNDNMNRTGVPIHNDSPGEEINYHGTMTQKNLHGSNYGYPDCVAVWNIKGIPNNVGLSVGQQFSHDFSAENDIADVECQSQYQSPRLTLPAHWAPIDIAFNSGGTVAYMTSKGSWNRNPPDGYKLFAITFENGQPIHPSTSNDAVIPILSSAKLPTAPVPATAGKTNSAACAGCLRPTGVTFDLKGRLYMASSGETKGEIFVVVRNDGRS
ncbi:soluble quino protein glucose dehydrogenase, partial [Tothia fuscella]